jgi:UDP-glucose 4-epimerase
VSKTSSQHRRIVVVGSGFIGARLANGAALAGHSTILYGRRQVELATGVRFVQGDAVDLAFRDLLEAGDQVVFAAGTSRPADSDDSPLDELDRNLRPLFNILTAVSGVAGAHFTLLSSGGTVYGTGTGRPAREDDEAWPVSTYGIAKLAAEKFVAMHASRACFHSDILRCSNIYGPGQPTCGSQGLIGIMLSKITAAETIQVYGDGSARRDFLHVDDLVEVVIRLGEKPDGVRVLNVGSGDTHSILDVVDIIARTCGVVPTLDFLPPRVADVPTVNLNIDRLRACIDFRPRALESGLESLAAAGAGSR